MRFLPPSMLRFTQQYDVLATLDIDGTLLPTLPEKPNQEQIQARQSAIIANF